MAKKSAHPRRYLVTQIIAFILLLIGAAVALYPFYVGPLNDMMDRARVARVEQANAQNAAAQEAAMAKENAKLRRQGLNANADPFAGLTNDAKLNLKRNMLGTVTVPSIKLTVPLFKTLSEETLATGAAVVPGTSMPTGGANTHTVIAGHRGLVDRRLFTDLNKVKKGNIFVLKVFNHHLAYKVFRIQVVKPDNTGVLQIEPGRDLATLLTCTPYMINSHRLLLTGKRVPYTPQIARAVKRSQQNENWRELGILAAAIAGLLAIIGLIGRHIHQLLLRRHVFRLLFYRRDPAGQPVAGARYQLCKKNGKPLYRRGSKLTVTSDEDGQVLIDHLPGGVYLLRELAPSRWQVRVGKKKLKQQKMRFYPTKHQATAVSALNERWVIQR
ncbi:class C sortase [Lacticaseibacillus jixianensis]|uniref:Class C sortase n=1 Tax=Lacticaseibacillus jixianensis TaxID=2486012 RepID=A0ABW4BC01_9LACO|nr:class C sortase [Lacticaseibacillus jixianensis]